MPKAVLPILALSLLLVAGAPAGAKESLPHETWVLDNGLRVILHEDHNLPLVTVNLWYHVGARDEPAGKSGFAHLFEHLMFMGTERVGQGEYDRILEEAGAWSNASTGYDSTDYYVVGPPHLLPTMLWLEADRMDSLGRAMTQEKLDLQRGVVKNEIRESYENESYGAANLRIHPEMYPPGHPYHRPVIGSHDDVDKATVEDVKRFFATYYVPNNATLVVAGDFDPAQAKASIQAYFGAVSRAADVTRRPARTIALDASRTVSVVDDVNYGRTTLIWHTPALYEPGDAEMDLIADVLAGGRQSPLFKRLVYDERIAVDVSAWQTSRRLGSLFYIQATVSLNVDPARVERAILEELQRLREGGPEVAALDRARAKLETDNVSTLQDLMSVADSLQTYDAYFGEADRLVWDLDRYRKATRAGVREAARQYLRPNRHLTMRVLPRTVADGEARPSSLGARPGPAEPRPFTPPVPETFELANGLSVWHLPRARTPLVAARLLVPAGSARDTRDTSGLSKLTSLMLREGAGGMDTLAFAAAAERRGATLWTWNARDGAGVGLEVLSRHAAEGLRLLGLAAVGPDLDATAFSRIRTRRALGVPRLGEDAEFLASRVAWQRFFDGRVDRYRVAPLGRAASLEAQTTDDVRAFHQRHYDPARSTLLLAGALTLAEARALADEHFGPARWPRGEDRGAALEPPPPPETPPAFRFVLVDRPDAEQTAIQWVLPGVAFDHPDRLALSVGVEILGGSFTSRLNARIREQEGLTYGAYASLAAFQLGGGIGASSSVETAGTAAAVQSFLVELLRFDTGAVSPEEVGRAVTTLRSNTVQWLDELTDVTALYAPYAVQGRKPTAVRDDYLRLGSVTPEDVAAAIRKHVEVSRGVLVLVGDKRHVLPQMDGLKGLPAPEVLTVEEALDL